MEQQYLDELLTAYGRGYALRTGSDAPPPHRHYFKRKPDLPRVQMALGFLRGIVVAGQCRRLLDVGSGRGAFLFPLLRDFPDLDVTAVELRDDRVELLQDLTRGGITRLTALHGDLCALTLPDGYADVVTLFEVLEHIPDTDAAVAAAVRLARRYVLLSVPSKPDDNPEHIHLFTRDDLKARFLAAGCRSVKFGGVNEHHFMIASR